MQNRDLVTDYMTRAEHRLAAVELLLSRRSFADVVRETQELVELCLKALLRFSKLEVPRSHDVGDLIVEFSRKLPRSAQPHAKELARVSHSLRRDRELSFYGSEDLTPSDFYKETDAQEAFEHAKWVFSVCREAIR